MRKRLRVREEAIHPAKLDRQPKDQKRRVVLPRAGRLAPAAREQQRRNHGVGCADEHHLPAARDAPRIHQHGEEWHDRRQSPAPIPERRQGCLLHARQRKKQLECEERRCDANCNRKMPPAEPRAEAQKCSACHHALPRRPQPPRHESGSIWNEASSKAILPDVGRHPHL